MSNANNQGIFVELSAEQKSALGELAKSKKTTEQELTLQAIDAILRKRKSKTKKINAVIDVRCEDVAPEPSQIVDCGGKPPSRYDALIRKAQIVQEEEK